MSTRFKPNRIEAEPSGVKITDDATLYRRAGAARSGVQRVFLSLGGDGVFAAQQGETHLEPICKAEMRNATGAGDAMMASLVWSFSRAATFAEKLRCRYRCRGPSRSRAKRPST